MEDVKDTRVGLVDRVAAISGKHMATAYFLGNILLNRMGKIPGSAGIVGVLGCALGVLFFIRCISWRRSSRWGVFFMGYWSVIAALNMVGAFQ